MKEKRKPNTKCKVCNKEIYKRPFEIESYGENLYCSTTCMFYDRRKTKIIQCPVCNKEKEVKTKSKQVYCSRICSGKVTRNRLGTKKGCRKGKNPSERRLNLLKETFDFSSCMVQGCEYDKIYHIHRFVEGKNGGLYEIGNMYAICPNHHAEVHAGLIELLQVSESELKTKGE